jgi:3-hydroxy-3-methylglutaryl CoA synthase/uncharacterized OB-fold protein
MVGIVSYGSYVPYRRLKRAAIAQVLGAAPDKGERAVASFDEDSISMAVEAARDALLVAPGSAAPEALVLATTTAPYADKLNAAIVGAALRLPLELRATDVTGSVRAGLGGLLAAADAVRGGARRALVAMADARLAAPEAKAERTNGDGAAAFVLGGEDVVAELVAASSLTREFLDTWRRPDEPFPHSWEERFALTQAHAPLLGTAVRSVLEKASARPGDLAAVVLDCPNPRAVADVAKRLQLDPARVADPLALTVGQTGAAHAGLLLASVLSAAQPGDLILAAVAADGADALVLRATGAVATHRQPRSVGRLIESKGDVGYGTYLKWREILPTEPPRRPDPQRPGAPNMLRASGWKHGLVGTRCTACGTPQLPPQRVCVRCRAKDRMEPYPFADRVARVATLTLDRLAFSLNPPTVSVVLDFDGGGRLLCEMTDCEPDAVRIGDEVEMTFRRMFTADGIENYFWKARPKR